MRDIVSLGGSVLFLFLFVWAAALNWWNLLNGFRGRKTGSFIPLVGGICGVFGLIFLGGEWSRHWVWLPLVLDFGTLPLIGWTILFFLFVLPFRAKRPPNL